ncbi:MAG: S8 family serine peptidase [Ilumatobacteraceae bacterium]
MDGVALLEALAVHQDVGVEVAGLDPTTLRFVVEYASPVDVATTAAEIEALIGVGRIQFFPLFDDGGADDELGEFYVLQFPGLDRTIDDRALFTIAHDLQQRLGAVSVEPDLGSELYREPGPPTAGPESVVKDRFHGSCFVVGDPPTDRRWALDRAGVLRAWAITTARGAGIRIAQPDTGITLHAELSDVSITDGFNVLNGSQDPTDPLSGGNPGHGTGTASVMTSGPNGHVLGPAPAATLVPIRCVESVILTFNGAAIAAAIDHARQRGCHIVTMSLGGTPSRAVKKAVKRAIQSDMIVLAAAGNCVGLVVYPARYDDVIAVAGSNVDDGTWRGSSHGGAVDITAPGEKVWKAIAGPDGTATGAGQGTSFAVALTAGVAALWLSHHGRQHVIEAAARRQMSVQALFRSVLVDSARTPAGWEGDEFGAGIVDAAALLLRSLEGPTPSTPEQAPGAAASDTMGLLAEALGPERASTLADVAPQPQFQLELSSLIYEDVRVGIDPAADADAEAVATRQAISPQLEAALGGRSGVLGSRPPRASVQPSPRAERIAPVDPVVLVAGAHSALESASGVAPELARESLRANADATLGALEERVARVRANDEGVGRASRTALQDQLLRDGQLVLQLLAEDQPIPQQSGPLTALEALVQLQGRPAVRLGDDGVDPADPDLGVWQGAIVLHPTFALLQRSVGRINTGSGSHIGTGFVVGDGLVMTNRHVVESLAFPTPSRSNPSGWVLNGAPVVNFSPSGTDADRSFRIVGIAFTGPDPIEGRIDLAHLDLAVVRVEQTNAHGSTLPAALELADPAVAVDAAAKLFVVGYPALPSVLPSDEAGRTRMDVVQRLREIYGMEYGIRYLSPGLVLTPAGQLPASPEHWVFTHDATSLGGNSGSCVLSFDHELNVAGLHFAGDWLRANYAHALDIVRAAIPGLVS